MDKSHTELFLVRHGRTDWNAEGRFQGSIERALDEHGVIQAEEVAGRLKAHPFHAIYCSHMLRARQTAEIIAKHHRLPIVCAYELREGTYGNVDGMKREEFYQKYADEIKIRDELTPFQRFHHRLIEGAESSAEILARVLPCLQTLSKCHKGQRIIVVTHGWVMRTLIVHFSAYADDKIVIDNGAVLHLKGEEDAFTILAHEGISNAPPINNIPAAVR